MLCELWQHNLGAYILLVSSCQGNVDEGCRSTLNIRHCRGCHSGIAQSTCTYLGCILTAAVLLGVFQGVRYGLAHWGRVLFADEMGVGKTVQALALAACYQVSGALSGPFLVMARALSKMKSPAQPLLVVGWQICWPCGRNRQ